MYWNNSISFVLGRILHVQLSLTRFRTIVGMCTEFDAYGILISGRKTSAWFVSASVFLGLETWRAWNIDIYTIKYDGFNNGPMCIPREAPKHKHVPTDVNNNE
jgi:hypothetical protein